jgi:murein L,D-transpeptidase YafK
VRARATVAVGLSLVVTALGLAGCEMRRRTGTPPAPGHAAASPDDDDARLAWAADEPWFVVVRKSCRTLDVYRHGVRVESFPAVFGLGGSGRKLYEGDLRTPTGLYMIVDSRPHPRWDRFLLLDYPNLQDLHQYWLAMEGGRIPRRGDRYAAIGGAVGIHGTDRPEANRRGEDWTFGCISLSNPDIEELADTVPVGTLVLIEE